MNKEKSYIKICEDTKKGKNIYPIKGGLRNTCYLYNDSEVKYFVKVYNEDTQYSKHMSECRCVSEFFVTKYLYDKDCHVAQPLYYDKEQKIGIYEYIEAKNIKAYGQLDMDLCFLVMCELSKIHQLPVVNEIGMCKFTDLDRDDLLRYLSNGIDFLCEIKEVKNAYIDSKLLDNIVNRIEKMNKVIGNTQLHDGNVLISENGEVSFCDFEKVCPHYPQMDIMSFINCRKMSIEDEKKIIDYYISINNIRDSKHFYCVYNLLFIIDCLRILKKIKYNEDGLKVKWVEVNGKKIKKFEKTKSDDCLLYTSDAADD